jgi:hypothetical protein
MSINLIHGTSKRTSVLTEIEREYPYTIDDNDRFRVWDTLGDSATAMRAVDIRTILLGRKGIVIHTEVNGKLVHPGRTFSTKMTNLWTPIVSECFRVAAIQGFAVVIVRRHASRTGDKDSIQKKPKSKNIDTDVDLDAIEARDIIVPEPDTYTIRWARVKGKRKYVAVPLDEDDNPSGISNGNVPLKVTPGGEIAGAFVYVGPRAPIGNGDNNGYTIKSMGWHACKIIAKQARADQDYEWQRHQAATEPLYLQSGPEAPPTQKALFVWYAVGQNGITPHSEDSERGASMTDMYGQAINRLAQRWTRPTNPNDAPVMNYERQIVPLPPGKTLVRMPVVQVDAAAHRAEIAALDEDIIQCFGIPLEFLRGGTNENIRAGVLASQERLHSVIHGAQQHMIEFLETLVKFYYGPALWELMMEDADGMEGLTISSSNDATSRTTRSAEKLDPTAALDALHVEFNRTGDWDVEFLKKLFDEQMISAEVYTLLVFLVYGISEQYMLDGGVGPERVKRKREEEERDKLGMSAKRSKEGDETKKEAKGEREDQNLHDKEKEERDRGEDAQGRAKKNKKKA